MPANCSRSTSTSPACCRARSASSTCPTPEQMADVQQAGLRVQPAARRPRRRSATGREDNPIPEQGRRRQPDQARIYIIKENRTYDQVFGDMKEGNGDPNLCLFREKVTPNHHKLARRVRAAGQLLRRRRGVGRRPRVVDGRLRHRLRREGLAAELPRQPAEEARRLPVGGQLRRHRPAGRRLPLGPLRRGGVSYRSYGEWVDNGKKPGDPGQAAGQGAGRAHRPAFRGFDLDYPDAEAGRPLHRGTAALREGGRDAAAHHPAAAERPHRRHEGRQADADGDGRRQRPGPGPGGRGGQQEQVLEGHGDLRDRGRRPERPRPRGRPPHRGPGHQPVHEARATSIRRCTRRAACCGRWN